MQLLGEASVVEGCQVVQVYRIEQELLLIQEQELHLTQDYKVMELLGEASVVEGCQVEQVFTKDRELKFKRPTRNTDVVSESNLIPHREKNTPPEHEYFFHLQFFSEFAPLTKKISCLECCIMQRKSLTPGTRAIHIFQYSMYEYVFRMHLFECCSPEFALTYIVAKSFYVPKT